MLTPTVLNVVLPFYAVGNTPAVSLTRCAPQGVDVDILLLGCGDVRHILYTAYCEKGFPNRKLDITSCDVEDAIIARNLLILTLLVAQGKEAQPQTFWNIYYHLFLDVASAQTLRTHLHNLLNDSESLAQWKQGQFGASFRFSNSTTLNSVRRVWNAYAEALAVEDHEKYQRKFETALKRSKNYKDATFARQGLVYSSARAAAPFGVPTMTSEELRLALDSWWEKGTTGAVPDNTDIPNPLFAASLSDYSVLAYGCDPILSYHLATASAHLAETSPLRPQDRQDGSSSLAIVEAAKLQFMEWSQAFVEMLAGNTVLRFVSADALSLCHTLQHCLKTGETTGHFYRRQLTMERLDLDSDEYRAEPTAPRQFDIIDTSNLSDYLGALNILISATPLLKDLPWATLYTETMEKGTEVERAKFEELLCGPTRTISTLLGISPVEYWTNATAISNVDEYLLAASATQKSAQKPSIQWRFAWKFHEHLSGHKGHARLKVKDDALVTLIHKVYRAMFASEDMMSLLSLSRGQQATLLQKQAYPRYHRGSLVAFIRTLVQTIDASKDIVCTDVLKNIMADSSLVLGSNFSQSLGLEMARHGLHTEPWLTRDIRRGPSAPLFSTWSVIPEAVAVTIRIPPVHWQKVAKVALEANVGFAVEGSLRSIQRGMTMWHNIFADVQVTFGTISTSGSRGGEDFAVGVDEDQKCWSGTSHMIVTFSVPAAALQVDTEYAKVSLCLQNSAQNISVFNQKLQLGNPMLGNPMAIYETDLDDTDHVYITKNQPGQSDGLPVYSSLGPAPTQGTKLGDNNSYFTAEIDSSGTVATITGHLDISSDKGKTLLAQKAVVDVRKISPFMFEVVLGKTEAVYTLSFPVPVVKEGSKTKIARKSAYVEIVAPLADPATAQTLDDFIFPTTLAKPSSGSGTGQTVPVTLNIPHVNLDTLPILEASDRERLGFLTTLTSWTFSVRERKLRDQINDSGLATSARLNFKESLFTMFMLASGLQGGQTGLFAIHHPGRGGIHMLVFVSAIRLDGANATVVLDAAVIPFTLDIIKGGRMEPFLLALRALECCTITVDDQELVLWKKVLPALVERCRDWVHAPGCEYAAPGASIPLSTEPGGHVLCSCGAGRLPGDFVGLPEWELAAGFATRLAISPTYAVPFVEDVIDPGMIRGLSGSAMAANSGQSVRCRNCGNLEARGGGPLKKCMRCLDVRYCSAECQKKDWKKHRMECEEKSKD